MYAPASFPHSNQRNLIGMILRILRRLESRSTTTGMNTTPSCAQRKSMPLHPCVHMCVCVCPFCLISVGKCNASNRLAIALRCLLTSHLMQAVRKSYKLDDRRKQ